MGTVLATCSNHMQLKPFTSFIHLQTAVTKVIILYMGLNLAYNW